MVRHAALALSALEDTGTPASSPHLRLETLTGLIGTWVNVLNALAGGTLLAFPIKSPDRESRAARSTNLGGVRRGFALARSRAFRDETSCTSPTHDNLHNGQNGPWRREGAG